MPSIVCLQETKLAAFDKRKLLSILPGGHATAFYALPSAGTSGGLLTSWDSSTLECTAHFVTSHTLTVCLETKSSNLYFHVSNVYGPCVSAKKSSFLQELEREVAPLIDANQPWVLLGDFNMIRSLDERSNNNFGAHLAAAFNNTIRALTMQEIPLSDHRFTWSNKQQNPVLAKLDRFLINNAWGAKLQATSAAPWDSSISDHTPILLTASTTIPRPCLFRFNNHWTHHPSFKEIMQSTWTSVRTSKPHLPSA